MVELHDHLGARPAICVGHDLGSPVAGAILPTAQGPEGLKVSDKFVPKRRRFVIHTDGNLYSHRPGNETVAFKASERCRQRFLAHTFHTLQEPPLCGYLDWTDCTDRIHRASTAAEAMLKEC